MFIHRLHELLEPMFQLVCTFRREERDHAIELDHSVNFMMFIDCLALAGESAISIFDDCLTKYSGCFVKLKPSSRQTLSVHPSPRLRHPFPFAKPKGEGYVGSHLHAGGAISHANPNWPNGVIQCRYDLAASDYGCSFWTQMFRKRTGV